MDDAFGLAPSLALIGASTQKDSDVVPVANARGPLPRFAPCQYRALGRHNNTWDVIDVISGVFACHKKVLFVDEGFGRTDGTDKAPKQQREGAENGNGLCQGSYAFPSKNGPTIVRRS